MAPVDEHQEPAPSGSRQLAMTRLSVEASERAARPWWPIVALLMLVVATGHFNRVAISVAGAEHIIRDSAISETRMGWVYSAFLFFYTLAMVPAGWLIDRVGA